MNRESLQQISRIRTQEANALLDAGCYPGAYYLIGYAVECALKACVARQVKRFDFPDKFLANKVFTHNLEKLVGLAGLGSDFMNDMKPGSKLNEPHR